ncbi:rho GTPase-activating protein gacU-like [Vespula squamosa]|uniref:Rho GTPase-activating protein gacU-like n=1 Tax=Vespula squamosa TaxID=30214 RepID=A0ABD2AK11_VESSQ
MPIIQPLLYLVTIVLCNVHGNLEHEVPRRSFLSRRAIDGTRGRKYFDPEEEGSFDSYGSAGGQYDRYKDKQDHSDIRMNVPGEPGTDYPAYTTLPQTGFSCEGRSRGYYADEVAGCQVFHVCHDILISSFLCPIGSIFSQKLLTCDWWSKVDCSTTRKFIEVNRDGHYQEDDDELIRKAYGMMGLQTGTDVASDELVDPDRGGRIIDYITIDSTGNDLPAYRNDLPRTKTPQFLSTYEEHSERANPTYPNAFYSKNYRTRPYQDSPIVRIEKIGEENYREPIRYDYQNIRDKSGKSINEFQPSYAPTVPTVTTTTRRLYSPTIPTTYRPSTLVYNRFDQAIGSSDHLYAHSQESRNVFTLSTPSNKNSKGKYNDSNPQGEGNDNEYRDHDLLKDEPSDSYELVKRIDSPEERFQVRPTFVEEEYIDGIEIKESIDIGRAFNASNKFRIHVRDPKDDAKDKNGGDSLSLLSKLHNATESLGSSEESVDQWQTETTDTLEYTSIFEKGTTPIIEYLSRFELKDNNTEIEESPTTTLSYEENLTSTETATIPLDKKLYSTENPRIFNNDDSESGTNIDQPDIVLKPPVFNGGNFRINVPDYLSTQIPIFHTSHRTTYSEIQTTTEVPIDERLVKETNASVPWFHRTTDLPARDIEPPFVNSKNNIDEIVTQSSIFDMVIQGVSTKDTNIYSQAEKIGGKVDDNIRRNSREQEEVKFVNESIEIFERDARPKILDSSTSLRYIEDAIERNNSPYQVSVTLNKKDESVPIKDDLIISLIERHERNTSTPDRLGQIEIVKSIEGITETGNNDFSRTNNNKILSSNDTINLSSNQKKVESSVGSSNVNALSLLQLMAELLKIDHIPRPFSLNNQDVKPNLGSNSNNKKLPSTAIKSVHDNLQREKIVESVPFNSDKKNVMPKPRDILDGTINPRSPSKDQILDELTNKYDRPLNNTENRLPIYQLPQIQRSLDFEEFKEFDNSSTILPSTTSFPRTTNVIESVKTVVETEFVPSIGFSFDTNEGRKKYIEAILGGLLNESIHESGTNKSFNVESIEGSSDN